MRMCLGITFSPSTKYTGSPKSVHSLHQPRGGWECTGGGWWWWPTDAGAIVKGKELLVEVGQLRQLHSSRSVVEHRRNIHLVGWIGLGWVELRCVETNTGGWVRTSLSQAMVYFLVSGLRVSVPLFSVLRHFLSSCFVLYNESVFAHECGRGRGGTVLEALSMSATMVME